MSQVEKKTIEYKNKRYNRDMVHSLMVTIASEGYSVFLQCFGPRQWEFRVEINGHRVSGIGFGPFYAIDNCLWNWKNKGLSK